MGGGGGREGGREGASEGTAQFRMNIINSLFKLLGG